MILNAAFPNMEFSYGNGILRLPVKPDEFRCLCRRLDRSNRVADDLGLLLHQFLGGVGLVFLEVVGVLRQFG